MPRTSRTHVAVDDNRAHSSPLKPKHLEKQEFARRLYNLMMNKGMRQADLARAADLKRDSVSTYIRGVVFPTPANLTKLARALGVSETELLPNYMESAIEADNPSFEMRVSSGQPGKSWVRVNRLVTTTTAVKIAELLEHDDASDRKGGR